MNQHESDKLNQLRLHGVPPSRRRGLHSWGAVRDARPRIAPPLLLSPKSRGFSGTPMARELGLSVNTVKSYIRRHPNIGNTVKCQWCEEPVLQSAGRKQKKFCSDRCRITYRNLVVAGSSSPQKAGAFRGPRFPQGGSAWQR